ncbi:MAG TPA: DUF4826 family protein [Aeromonadales bacterium]|nr:DUF4826 family protein [Aeromonadales bacterium]
MITKKTDTEQTVDNTFNKNSASPTGSSTFDPNNSEDVKRWGQEQYAQVMKYCNKNLLTIDHLQQSKSSVLPPLLAIWNIKLLTKPASEIWVIGGKVSMDHVSTEVASNAREALRHFSLSWQMKASTLERNLQSASNNLDLEQQKKVIQTLITEAEAIYDLYADDNLWKQSV